MRPPKSPAKQDLGSKAVDRRVGLFSGVIVAAAAGLIGGWLAAGSTGLLAHSLRRGLASAALGFVVVAAWPKPSRPAPLLGALLIAAVVAAALIHSSLPAVNVLAAAVILLTMAQAHAGTARTSLRLAAEAVLVLALYRVALTTIPFVWLSADRLGEAIGAAAGSLLRRPLWVGATFAGLDFLVPMLYLAILAPLRLRSAPASPGAPKPESHWPGRWSGPWRPTLAALAAIAIGHGLYLGVLSFAPDVLAHLPEPKPMETPLGPEAPPRTPLTILRAMTPWNLPLLAAGLHGLIAWGLLGLLARSHREPQRASPAPLIDRAAWAAAAAAVVLAAAYPALAILSLHRPDLNGKKIVFLEEGFLNWMKPVHGEYGRLSIGMYGMLPKYLGAFGAEMVRSPDLSEADLKDADAVVLIYPNEPWKKGQLERLWDYVRRGGNLLVLGEHTVQEKDGGNRFNEALRPTGMQVRFDSATFAVGGWLHCYETVAHPISAGVGDEQNEFGSVIGASMEVHWPARPLLIGRWGWADPGDLDAGEAKMGNHQYDAGEKLGDLILAAEQPLGAGRVVGFGDTSGFTNGLTPGCHVFTSRLFAYLAERNYPAPSAWRFAAGLLVLLGLLGLVVWRPSTVGLAATALALGASLALSTDITHRNWELLPDGRISTPNQLAYLDGSRPAHFSQESWRPDGLAGLGLTLMRDDFLVLNLPEITAERLRRARLLVSVGPAREFSEEEREIVKDFVANGGIFISTVGYPEIGPSKELLSDFGFYVGLPPGEEYADEEPFPLGHFKAPFFNGGTYVNYVRFHAAWPVFCVGRPATPVALYPGNVSIITVRRYRKGLVAVVGDTHFATNKNLENEGGEPFEGMRENAVFWRWFVSWLRDGVGEGEIWYPPPEKEGQSGEPLSSGSEVSTSASKSPPSLEARFAVEGLPRLPKLQSPDAATPPGEAKSQAPEGKSSAADSN